MEIRKIDIYVFRIAIVILIMGLFTMIFVNKPSNEFTVLLLTVIICGFMIVFSGFKIKRR